MTTSIQEINQNIQLVTPCGGQRANPREDPRLGDLIPVLLVQGFIQRVHTGGFEHKHLVATKNTCPETPSTGVLRMLSALHACFSLLS